jgi:DNA-binding SARP family transcriptional activator
MNILTTHNQLLGNLSHHARAKYATKLCGIHACLQKGIRFQTVATLLLKHFECLNENRDNLYILQPRNLYESLFLRLYT